MLDTALLICCSLLRAAAMTPAAYDGENMTRPAPEAREGRANLRLPFYTSGFE